jgi:hypothetical protein
MTPPGARGRIDSDIRQSNGGRDAPRGLVGKRAVRPGVPTVSGLRA